MSFSDVVYREATDEADVSRDARERMAQLNRDYANQDDRYASGLSLEMGTPAYNAMIMDAHGLSVHEQEDVVRGQLDWKDNVDGRDTDYVDERELDYREELEQDRLDDGESVDELGTFVKDDRKREQMLSLTKAAAVAAARDDLRAIAAAGYGRKDSEVAEAMIDDIEHSVEGARSAEVIQNMTEAAEDTVRDTSHDEYAEDVSSGEVESESDYFSL